MRVLGIQDGNGSTLPAAMGALVLTGTIKFKRLAAGPHYYRARTWGPSVTPEEAPEARPGGDRAMERARDHDRAAGEEYVRRILDERLRAHGLL